MIFRRVLAAGLHSGTPSEPEMPPKGSKEAEKKVIFTQYKFDIYFYYD